MKQLLGAIVLIILIGVGGFLYRNVLEKPEVQACTMDAKVCPDGSAVGRTGPSCTFAPCLFPNAEDTVIGIGFVVPSGYVANEDVIGADESLRAVFEKENPTGLAHAIVIRRYPLETGKTVEEIIVENTIFETADMGAESIDQFTKRTVGENEYYVVVVERFEAQIHSLYYLPRADDVLRFEVLERDVEEWMEPNLVVESLPEHQALLQLLGTLQLYGNTQ